MQTARRWRASRAGVYWSAVASRSYLGLPRPRYVRDRNRDFPDSRRTRQWGVVAAVLRAATGHTASAPPMNSRLLTQSPRRPIAGTIQELKVLAHSRS